MKSFEEITAQIKNNSKKIDKLFKENSKLEAERQKAGILTVKNKKLFKELTWEVEVWNDAVRLKGSYKGTKIPKVFNILRDRYSSYHYQINIEPNVISNFDDEEITLSFTNINYITYFAKEWGIKISTSDLTIKLNETQNKLYKISGILNLIMVHQHLEENSKKKENPNETK